MVVSLLGFDLSFYASSDRSLDCWAGIASNVERPFCTVFLQTEHSVASTSQLQYPH